MATYRVQNSSGEWAVTTKAKAEFAQSLGLVVEELSSAPAPVFSSFDVESVARYRVTILDTHAASDDPKRSQVAYVSDADTGETLDSVFAVSKPRGESASVFTESERAAVIEQAEQAGIPRPFGQGNRKASEKVQLDAIKFAVLNAREE